MKIKFQIVVVVLMISCNNDPFYKKNDFKKFDTSVYQVPIKNYNFDVFILNKNTVGKIEMTNLLKLYLIENKNLKCSLFLENVFNNKVNIDCEVLDTCFDLNKEIKNEYKRKGLEYLKNKYFDSNQLKIDKNNEKLLTIQYYYFINGLALVQNCYSGEIKLLEIKKIID